MKTLYKTLIEAYERGRTLEFTNKPALRMSGCYNRFYYVHISNIINTAI